MTDDITTITRRHSWNESNPVYLDGHDCTDGNDRTEKTCPKCRMVKITVHPPRGFPWHEWRTKDGKTWQGTSTPPCLDPEPVCEPVAAGEVAGQ